MCYLSALNCGPWYVGYIKGYNNGKLLCSFMEESLQVLVGIGPVMHLLNVFVLYLLRLGYLSHCAALIKAVMSDLNPIYFQALSRVQ